MSAAHSRGRDRQPACRVRSGLVGMGVRQRRVGQDPRAGATRHPAASRRHRSGENPVPDLHQGRSRQYGEPHLRHAQQMGEARRRRARRGHSRDRRRRNRPETAGAGAAAVRRGAGDAGRAQGADHPRLLHAAPAAVSVRGQCRRAFSRARRDPAEPDPGRHPPHVLLDAARQPDSARRTRAGRHHSDRQRLHLPARAERSDPGAQRNRGLGRSRRRPRCGDAASFRPRSASRPSDTLAGVEAEIVEGPHLPLCAMGIRVGDLRAEFEERPGPGGAPDRSAGGARAQRASKPISRCFFTDKGDPRKQVITAGLAKTQPELARRFADEQARMPLALRKAARRADARPHHGAAHARNRDDRSIHRRKEPPRIARLRRPDHPHPHPPGALGIGLGALQARPRHRPSAGRRSAGHEPRAVGHHQAVRRRVHQRRRRARRLAALDLRGRRRQAIDLLVPGRGAGSVRRDARLLQARARGCWAAVPARSVPIFVPVRARGAGGGGCRVQAASRPRRPDGHCRGDLA